MTKGTHMKREDWSDFSGAADQDGPQLDMVSREAVLGCIEATRSTALSVAVKPTTKDLVNNMCEDIIWRVRKL